MVGKPILRRKGNLRILVDSRSLATLLADGNQTARNLLKYSACEPFEFIRTPIHTAYEELEAVQLMLKDMMIKVF